MTNHLDIFNNADDFGISVLPYRTERVSIEKAYKDRGKIDVNLTWCHFEFALDHSQPPARENQEHFDRLIQLHGHVAPLAIGMYQLVDSQLICRIPISETLLEPQGQIQGVLCFLRKKELYTYGRSSAQAIQLCEQHLRRPLPDDQTPDVPPAGRVFLAILDHTIRQHNELLDNVEVLIKQFAEPNVNPNPRELGTSPFSLKTKLLALRHELLPIQKCLSQLAGEKEPYWFETNSDNIKVNLAAVQNIIERIDIESALITEAVNNSGASETHQLNLSVRKLTAFSFILGINSIVISLFDKLIERWMLIWLLIILTVAQCLIFRFGLRWL